MKDMPTMMLALQHFCARHGAEMPASVEIRFAREDDARTFERGLKADYDSGTTTLTADHSGIDKVCSTPLRIAYADHEGRPVRV
jgi:hypothetical protein